MGDGNAATQNPKITRCVFFTSCRSNLAEDMPNDRPERAEENDVGIWLAGGGYEVCQEGSRSEFRASAEFPWNTVDSILRVEATSFFTQRCVMKTKWLLHSIVVIYH